MHLYPIYSRNSCGDVPTYRSRGEQGIFILGSKVGKAMVAKSAAY
jgi:hypothetical protein